MSSTTNDQYDTDSKSAQSFTLKLPAFKRPKLELWQLIDPNNMDTLLRCFQIDDYDEFMKRLDASNIKIDNSLKLERYALFVNLLSHILDLDRSDKRDLILIDQFYYLVEFGLANAFNKEQINSLMSILHRTHSLACDSSFGNLTETFTYFRQFLVLYTVHRPPFSLGFFSPREVEIILDYVLDTYFNQFKFFKYVYTPAVRLNMRFEYTNQELLPSDVTDAGEAEFKELDMAESMINEDEEERVSGLQSRLTGDDKSANELKQFVRKYLGAQLDKAKKDILTESVDLDASLQTDGGKLSSRKTSAKPGVKTPSIKKK
jgi:hypothetical protein